MVKLRVLMLLKISILNAVKIFNVSSSPVITYSLDQRKVEGSFAINLATHFGKFLAGIVSIRILKYIILIRLFGFAQRNKYLVLFFEQDMHV